MLQNATEAEDLTQDVLFAIVNRQLSRRLGLRRGCTEMTHNQVLMHFRKRNVI